MSFSVQKLDGCEILLGPEVTYGPPGLDLLSPVAMSIAHCAEVDAETWSIRLRRRSQDSKWEVRRTNEPVAGQNQWAGPVGGASGVGVVGVAAEPEPVYLRCKRNRKVRARRRGEKQQPSKETICCFQSEIMKSFLSAAVVS